MLKNVINKYHSLKTTRNYATRTINDVKEVVDDRVSVVHDLKTDSVITAAAKSTSKFRDL